MKIDFFLMYIKNMDSNCDLLEYKRQRDHELANSESKQQVCPVCLLPTCPDIMHMHAYEETEILVDMSNHVDSIPLVDTKTDTNRIHKRKFTEPEELIARKKHSQRMIFEKYMQCFLDNFEYYIDIFIKSNGDLKDFKFTITGDCFNIISDNCMFIEDFDKFSDTIFEYLKKNIKFTVTRGEECIIITFPNTNIDVFRYE